MALRAPVTAILLLSALSACARLEKFLPAGGARDGTISRTALEKSGQPVMQLRVPSRGVETLLTMQGRSGDVVTWRSANGLLFSFRDGILIETRGFGADLTAPLAPNSRQILSGPGHTRSYTFPDAAGQTAERSYICSVARDGREMVTIYGRPHMTDKVSEVCEAGTRRITNHYWLESGRIRKSREWVSPDIGQIEFERIVD